MLRNVFILLFLVVIRPDMTGQIRHVKGIDMAGVRFGVISGGYNGGVTYSYRMIDPLSVELSGLYERVFIMNFEYSAFMFSPGLSYTILSNHKSVFLNAYLEACFGMDVLRSSGIDLDRSRFVLGEVLGFKAEVFIFHNFKIDLIAAQRIFQKNQNESLGLLYAINCVIKI